MTVQESCDQCMNKFINIDVGFMGIVFLPITYAFCMLYAIITSFECILFFVMVVLYYILKD